MDNKVPRTHYARRLLFAVMWLVVLDQFVPPLLRVVEKRRYEGNAAFRFPASDVFALGPAVSYLREHPHGDRSRMIFLGNSITFGFGLDPEEAAPAQFERLQPPRHAWNMAINASSMGTSYLIYKDVIDSADCAFIQFFGVSADEALPALIPVNDTDVARFHLRTPDPMEKRLESGLGAVWHLYGLNYQMQTALFGTSTSQSLYINKRNLARSLIALVHRLPPEARPVWQSGNGAQVEMHVPRSPALPDKRTGQLLRSTQSLLWSLGTLAKTHRKHLVLLHLDMPGQVWVSEPEAGEFNTLFAPFAEIVQIKIPRALTYDGEHMTPEGARSFANALARVASCGGPLS
jgi:hypothetical protein